MIEHSIEHRTVWSLWKAVVSVQYEHITTHRELTRFCEAISEANTIAFDTEFVSEDCYRPHLCLVQVSAADRLAMIDQEGISQEEETTEKARLN